MPSLPASSTPTRRRLGLAALVGLVTFVLLAHAALLGLLPPGVAGAARSGPPAALQVRQIREVAALAARAAPLQALPVLEHEPLPAPEPALQNVALLTPVALNDARPELQAGAQAADQPGTQPATLLAAANTAAAAPTPIGVELPVYRTRVPPPAVLHFEIKRGALGGVAEMKWLPRADGYELSLEGRAFGIRIIAWHSEGGIDANGLAPSRFTDSRHGRNVQAANFQRDKGLISYSGPAVQYALVPGAQDRLSWMLQLPAILQGNARLSRPGSQISLFVTGARGDADVWTFEVVGLENVEVSKGRVNGAVHLHREPRKPFDSRVDVWLDPARSHLPVRLVLGERQNGDANEFLLRDISTP